MIIPARKLTGYVSGLTFPLDLKPEAGDRVLRQISLAELTMLVAVGQVIGIGHGKRIRYLRLLNEPIQSSAVAGPEAMRLDGKPRNAECERTVVLQSLADAGRKVYGFHRRRIVCWRDRRPALDTTCL